MTTGTTPILALPFPNGDDPVANGDNVIRSLTTRLDIVAAPVTAHLFLSVATQAFADNTIQRVNTATARPALTAGWTQAGSQLIVPRTGEYRIAGQIAWASINAAGARLAFITLNHAAGVFTDATTMVAQATGYLGSVTGGLGYNAQITRTMRLAAGDKLDLWGRQQTGVSLNVNGTATTTNEGGQTWFEATYLGGA